MAHRAGKYDLKDLERVKEVAQRVAAGAKSFAQAAGELAGELNRSERGVRLMLGRAVSRMNGNPPRSRRSRRSAASVKTPEAMLRALKNLARERSGLLRERDRVVGRLDAVDKDISTLRARLMSAVGLEDLLRHEGEDSETIIDG